MKNHKDCEIIRRRIEEGIIGTAAIDRSELNDHMQSCSDCRTYAAQLETLSAISNVRYTLPAHERGSFSAKVRTRIEDQKTSRRKPAFIAQPAFQIVVLIMIIVSVALYLINTEPAPVFVVEWDNLEYLNEYTFYYDDMIIPDNGIIIDLYAETLFGEDFYHDDFRDAGYFDDEYYYTIDLLSPEEIEDIIQRMEGA